MKFLFDLCCVNVKQMNIIFPPFKPNNKMKATITLLCFVLGFSAIAQDSLKTAEPESELSKFKFSGYIDAYYFSNLNNPASRNNLGISGNALAFDQRSGTIGIGLVQAKMTYAPSEKTDVVVDLTFGPNADLGNYG